MSCLCSLRTNRCPTLELQYATDLEECHQQFLEAVDYNNTSVVQKLLKRHKIDVTVHGFATEGPPDVITRKSRFNALHVAAINGNIKLVKLLLKHSNLSYCQKREFINTGADEFISGTALHFAVQKNHLSIVKLLIDNGADINKDGVYHSEIKDRNGIKLITLPEYTVLRMASSQEMRELLLEHGANPNKVLTNSNRLLALPLQHLAANDNSEAIQLLLKHNADVNLRTDKTALQVACEHLSLNAIGLLLKHDANMLVEDGNGLNCLAFVLMNLKDKTPKAVTKKVTIAIDMLLKAAKRLNITDDLLCQENKSSVISYVIRSDTVEIFHTLIKAASVEALRRNKGILRVACLYASRSLSRLNFFKFVFNIYEPELPSLNCQILSEILLDIIKDLSRDDQAVAKVMEKLLKNGADSNYYDRRYKFSLLHHASANGYITAVRVLRSHGACVNSRGCDGSTPLHFAVSGNFPEIVRELLNASDRGDKADLTCQTNEKKTALHVALQNGYTEIARYLVENESADHCQDTAPLIDLYHSGSSYPQGEALCHTENLYQSQSGKYTLDISTLKSVIESGCVETLKYFAEIYDLSVNSIVIRPSGWTILHELAEKHEESSVKEALSFLLTKVKDVDVATSEGVTALHIACGAGNVDIVEFLVKHHANICAVTVYNWNVFHFAILSGNIAILKWLLSLNDFSCHIDASHLGVAVFRNLPDMCCELLARGVEIAQQVLSNVRFFHLEKIEAILHDKQEADAQMREQRGSQLKAITQPYCTQTKHERNSLESYSMGKQMETTFSGSEHHSRMESAVRNFAKSRGIDFDADTSGLNLLQKQGVIKSSANMVHFSENIECSCVLVSAKDRNSFCISLLTKNGSGKLPDVEEILVIEETVKDYVRSFCYKVKDIDGRFEIFVEGAGSSFENCKVGHPDEFDFMCTFVKFNGKISEEDVCEFSKVTHNFIKLILKEGIREDYEEFCDASGFLNSSDVNFHFYCLIEEAMNKAKLPKNLHLSSSGLYGRVKENGIYPAGAKLKLFWTGRYYAALNIEVDLTPAIFLDNLPAGLNAQIKDTFKGYHVIAKPLASKDISISEASYCWRVSLSTMETKLISQHCTEDQQDVFMMAKILRQYVPRRRLLNECPYTAEETITSYLLKNEFLKMVFDVEEEEVHWGRNNVGANVIKLYLNLKDVIVECRNQSFGNACSTFPGSFFLPACRLLSDKTIGDSRKATLTYESISYANLILDFIMLDILQGVLCFEYTMTVSQL